jgi:hypothetical protein
VEFDPKHIQILRQGPKGMERLAGTGLCGRSKLGGSLSTTSELQLAPINGGPINLANARLSGAYLAPHAELFLVQEKQYRTAAVLPLAAI